MIALTDTRYYIIHINKVLLDSGGFAWSSPVRIKFRNSWQCQKCSLMRGGDTYLATGRPVMSGILPSSWGILPCIHLTSYIRRVLRLSDYNSQIISYHDDSGLSTPPQLPANIWQIREDFSPPDNPIWLKRYNFVSIVGLINYCFTSIFLYLSEKIRLHILISRH